MLKGSLGRKHMGAEVTAEVGKPLGKIRRRADQSEHLRSPGQGRMPHDQAIAAIQADTDVTAFPVK